MNLSLLEVFFPSRLKQMEGSEPLHSLRSRKTGPICPEAAGALDDKERRELEQKCKAIESPAKGRSMEDMRRQLGVRGIFSRLGTLVGRV